MKVRCVQLLDSRGKPAVRSAWARVGVIYHVLGIWVEPAQASFRLVGQEASTPALFETRMFEVVSGAIPGSWRVQMPRPGCLDIGPATWALPGFWEAYFEGQQEAVSAFEEERVRIIEADP